jgi:hypothetical protein
MEPCTVRYARDVELGVAARGTRPTRWQQPLKDQRLDLIDA